MIEYQQIPRDENTNSKILLASMYEAPIVDKVNKGNF